MGGEAAKERRRLKRLEAGKVDGAATPSGQKPIDKKSDGDAPNQPKFKGEKGNSSSTELQLRIQRKMARKASGQFKAHAAQNPKPPTPAPTSAYKRKSEGADNNRNAPHHPSSFKRGPNDNSFNKNTPFKGKTNPRNKKDFPPAKKNNITKHKVKKPKHLKRKMDQLSKTIAEGNSISDLEDQMKLLAEKMEELKKLKQKNDLTAQVKQSVVVDSKDDVGKGKQSAVVESKDDVGKDKQSVVVESKDDVGKDKQSLVVESKDDVGKDKQSVAVESKDDVGKDKKSVAVESKDDVGKDKKSVAVESKDDLGKDKQSVVVESKDDVGKKGSDEKVKDEPQKGGGAAKIVKKETSNDSSVQDTKATKSDESQTKESSSSSSSSGSSDDDSSSDEDEIADTSNTRSRGKRGRGRIDNNPEEKRSPEEEPASKKTSKKDDKRRCIGRKPITDYVIGKTYSGPVKYIKPKLGAFIDLGAHSDAFCHISCISDTFVSSVMDVLKVGDVVENARVVEIDREKKRITVSLRSEEMAENEQDKLKTTRQYEDGLNNRNRYTGRNGDREKSPTKQGHGRFDGAESKANASSGYTGTNCDAPPSLHSDLAGTNAGLNREKLEQRTERRAQNEQTVNSPAASMAEGQWRSAASFPAQSGQKSGADLKRERKLARRAERRAANQDAS